MNPELPPSPSSAAAFGRSCSCDLIFYLGKQLLLLIQLVLIGILLSGCRIDLTLIVCNFLVSLQPLPY